MCTACVAISCGACADAEAPTVTYERLESGRVIVRNGPEAPRWGLRELFRLGSLDTPGPTLFGEVRDLALDGDGLLYVLDGQAAEVRVFGPAGEYLRTLGSPGRGPGELSSPLGMTLDAQGTVWVLNMGNGRYTAFDASTGEVVAEPRRQARFGLLPWPGVFDQDGHLTDVTVLDDGTLGLVRLGPDFAITDSISAPMPDDRYGIMFWKGDLSVASVWDPFAPTPVFAFAPSGGVVFGEGDAYRIHRVSFASDTTLTIEVAREPWRVTAAERDSALAAFDDFAAEVDAEPDRRPRVMEVKPAHGPVFVDDQDRIWVRRTQPRDGPVTWDLLSADGRLAGYVVEPVIGSKLHVPPVVAGGRLAMTASPGGVPTVVVLELVPTVQ